MLSLAFSYSLMTVPFRASSTTTNHIVPSHVVIEFFGDLASIQIITVDDCVHGTHRRLITGMGLLCGRPMPSKLPVGAVS